MRERPDIEAAFDQIVLRAPLGRRSSPDVFLFDKKRHGSVGSPLPDRLESLEPLPAQQDGINDDRVEAFALQPW